MSRGAARNDASTKSKRGLLRPGVGVAVLGWGVGAAVTALIAWTPFLSFGFRSPSFRLVMDTIDACVALLVAYLVHARFVRRGHWQDRFLAQGLVLLAVAGLGLTYVVRQLPGVRPGTLDVWLPLTLRIGGALCILVAALADGRPVRRAWALRHAWLMPLTLVLGVSLALWLVRDRVPLAFGSASTSQSGEHQLLGAHLALMVGHGFSAVCYFIASAAFAHQSARRDDELLRWLGGAFALAAFARVNYLLFPSLYTHWFYTGDLLRTGCYLLLLIGAGRELHQYWGAQAEAAVLEDRRRLARELHDGVIQELAYIRSESYALPADLTAGDRIIAACDRGLDEARAAVQALGRPADEPLGFVLHRAARELAERYDVDLEVDVDDSISVEPDQQHALMRITREAISNAVRHGKAERVDVRLLRTDHQLRLLIQDNGRGFDVPRALVENSGYGLLSMRERARTLPGSLDLEATPGQGSLVTVTW